MPKDNSVKIVKADGSLWTVDKADLITSWSTTDAYSVYGGDTDLWGETRTAADINDVDFGVVFSGNDELTRPLYVDHIRATIYYTATTGATMTGVQSMTWIWTITL